MCQPASFCVTQNRVLWSANTDSHAEIIEAHHLHPETPHVRVEIVPRNKDYSLPPEEWTFELDMVLGYCPWFDIREVEATCRQVLVGEWLPGHTVETLRDKVYADKGVRYVYTAVNITQRRGILVIDRLHGKNYFEGGQTCVVDGVRNACTIVVGDAAAVVVKHSSRSDFSCYGGALTFLNSNRLRGQLYGGYLTLHDCSEVDLCVTSGTLNAPPDSFSRLRLTLPRIDFVKNSQASPHFSCMSGMFLDRTTGYISDIELPLPTKET